MGSKEKEMKSKSAHNKGKRFENYLNDYFAKNVDGYSRRTIGSGAGLDKGDIRLPQHNIVIEAKNQMKLSVIDWWEQTVSQAFNEIPVLIFRNPRKAEFNETLVLLSLEDFTALLRANRGELEGVETQYTLDYETRNALKSLKNSVNAVLNKIPHE